MDIELRNITKQSGKPLTEAEANALADWIQDTVYDSLGNFGDNLLNKMKAINFQCLIETEPHSEPENTKPTPVGFPHLKTIT